VYAWEGGVDRSIESIVDEVRSHKTTLVEVTGGEPLLQADTPALCSEFIDTGYTVLVETNGSIDISVLPAGVVRIVDIKTPSSGHAERFLDKNYKSLRMADECKFVISDKKDFDWSIALVREKELDKKSLIIFSPNMQKLAPDLLAEWVVEENAPVRLGLQLHKIIWGDRRGV